MLLFITGVKVMVEKNFEKILKELKSAASSVLNTMEFLVSSEDTF